MSSELKDFERRLRALLAAKTGREIPPDTQVLVEVHSSGSDDDSRGLDMSLVVQARGPWVDYEYPEPGAWLRLLADLEAVELE